MVVQPNSTGPLALRLMVALALLGCPRMGSAAGTWSVISLPQKPGEVLSPGALAEDTAGNLYVADGVSTGTRIQKRDAQGSWSLIATNGTGLGQVSSSGGPDLGVALAVDLAGNLYVAESKRDTDSYSRIQKRDTQGNWSVIATYGSDLGQVSLNYRGDPLAADTAGNLYVAEYGRIQKRDAQGNWSVIATTDGGTGLGQVVRPRALAVDAAGNLYVADGIYAGTRIQKRDAQGNWSPIAAAGGDLGQVSYASPLAVDAAGNLYVADGRIQKRDAQGNWSVVATEGTDPGQVGLVSGLAVDAVGGLYVAEDFDADGNRNGRIQKRNAQGNWSVIAIEGTDPGQVSSPSALAVDAAGDLYVVDTVPATDNTSAGTSRIQKRDAQGNWSVIDAQGASALAVDTAGNLYVADGFSGGRIQKRDAQGNWSVLATAGMGLGRVSIPSALAVDVAGNLYAADWSYPNGRIQKRDAQGSWSLIATYGAALGQVGYVNGLAVDIAGNLYVADVPGGDYHKSRIQKRDAQGSWSLIATYGGATLGQVQYPSALAVDTAGSLYVADNPDAGPGQIQRRDAQGSWALIATYGAALGQVYGPAGLAGDAAGDLYVADTGNNRVQVYTPGP